ncbi:protein MIZU-KUSSEI [Salix suchowensis]|nr:protein MIZU-KUSSEI [Salix suchowensis]
MATPPYSLTPVQTRSRSPPTFPSPPTTPSSGMTNPMSPIRPAISLHQPNSKKGSSKHNKIFRRVRAVFRSFPIITPACKIPGTLYGHRKARVSLAIQESPGSLPLLLLELTIPTGKLLQDMGGGLVRIALECEKKPNDKTRIEDEPIWTLFCNGRKCGYAAKREPTDEDFNVMQPCVLFPWELPADGELTYMRAFFERVAGSKDSETYYMLNPDGNNGPELSLFFVRL